MTSTAQVNKSARPSSAGLSIKVKLRLVFLFIAFMFVGMGWLVHQQMNQMSTKTADLTDNWMPSIVFTSSMDAAIAKLRLSVSYYVLLKDPKEKEQAEDEFNSYQVEVRAIQKKYEPLISSADEKKIYDDLSQGYEAYLQGEKAVIAFAKQGKPEQAGEQIKRNGLLFNAVGDNLDTLVETNRLGGVKSGVESAAIRESSQQQLVVVTLLLLGIVMVIVWWYETRVSKPLEVLTATIKQLAQGDTNVTQDIGNRQDEVGQMSLAVGNIATTLQALSKDALTLIESAQHGVLSMRVDVQRHPGEFGEIVGGMNCLLEELSKPLTDVAQVMQQLALGNLTGRMQGAYEGDLRALKANVNRSLDTLVSLLEQLGDVTKRLANGDLTQTLTGTYQGDFSDLKNNVNQAVTQLKEVLQTVVDNAGHMSSASLQTSQAATLVARQTAAQMTALEEVAVVIEETAAAVNEISKNSADGSQLANSTAELAEQGRLQLAKLIGIIEQVATQYRQIESSTGKISRIADKTHLLSLNAGLEAVRAGEHGLGFGFVAQQIGKLAEEAALSARDIGTVIAGSAESVLQSVAAAQETRTAIERIALAAASSGDTVRAISAGIAQQSVATESLSLQVIKLQSASEENAAAAEEISNSMRELESTVELTVKQTQQFKLR